MYAMMMMMMVVVGSYLTWEKRRRLIEVRDRLEEKKRPRAQIWSWFGIVVVMAAFVLAVEL